MNKFKTDKYLIIENAVEKNLCNFLYNYVSIKRQVAKTLIEDKYISPFENMFGVWNDDQVPNTYSHYSDIAMETLLLKLQPIIEKHIEIELNPSYSFFRFYKKNDELPRHKDRFSCEISSTLNLGGDLWDIYLEPSGEEGKDGKKITLNQGDMLIYKGCELEHWRNKFDGNECLQVFFHYNNKQTFGSDTNLFDTRKHVGLPAYFKRS